jgi:hypothetical protein
MAHDKNVVLSIDSVRSVRKPKVVTAASYRVYSPKEASEAERGTKLPASERAGKISSRSCLVYYLINICNSS